MLPTTSNAVREILRADPSLSTPERTRLLALLRNHGKADVEPTAFQKNEIRICRRGEVARMLGCGLRCLDNWNRMGILKKVTLPGRKRAAGFRLSDVVALIERQS